MTVIWKCKTV